MYEVQRKDLRLSSDIPPESMETLEFDIAIAGDSSGTEVGAIVSKERGGELKAGIIGLGAGDT